MLGKFPHDSHCPSQGRQDGHCREGPHAQRGGEEVGEGGGGPRGRGEVGEARRVCQARAGAGHLHAAKARSTSGLARRSVGGSVGGRQSLARGRACPRSPCLPPKLASTAVHRGPGDHMIREKQAQKLQPGS